MINETRVRTLTKTVSYRILSVIAIVLLALAFGADSAIAGILGMGAVVLGSTSYYLHDRVWLKFGFLTQDTNEKPVRSLVKSITYRIIVLMIAFGLTRSFLTTSNATAATFTLIQMVINFILYYTVERVFNRISWGKKLPEPLIFSDK